MSEIVTNTNQVTIPKEFQELLGIKPGSKVEFRRNAKGRVELIRADELPEDDDNPFRRFLGHAGPGLTTDEIMEMTRGED